MLELGADHEEEPAGTRGRDMGPRVFCKQDESQPTNQAEQEAGERWAGA